MGGARPIPWNPIWVSGRDLIRTHFANCGYTWDPHWDMRCAMDSLKMHREIKFAAVFIDVSLAKFSCFRLTFFTKYSPMQCAQKSHLEKLFLGGFITLTEQ